jgi:protein-L-isoaspartate(D-aspartate) O-methyltransferase
MVREQIAARGVADPRVLAAMAAVPRHRFVGPGQQALAHADQPLPLGPGQTISQPFIVARMAEALGLAGGERVLEVGSGCGYMAAVLSRLAREVWGVELEERLCAEARDRLAELGCGNVVLRCGDGAGGWPQRAPFDAILFSCAAAQVPAGILEQLRPGGRLLLPLGPPGAVQELVLLERTGHGSRSRSLGQVSFVPLR